jgi:hypothetical protein
MVADGEAGRSKRKEFTLMLMSRDERRPCVERSSSIAAIDFTAASIER